MTAYSVGAINSSATQLNAPDTMRLIRVVEATVDVAATSGATSVNAGAGLTSGDTVKIIPLAKDAVVLSAGMEVLTAFTASTTLALGDTGSGTRYASATAVTTTGEKVATPSVSSYNYAAADYIVLTVGGANPTVGKARVWIVLGWPTSVPAATTAVL